MNAKCSASSAINGNSLCGSAFNGAVNTYWTPNYNIKNKPNPAQPQGLPAQPKYWIEWISPKADTIGIWQTGHEHSTATLVFGGVKCTLNLNRVRGKYVKFDLSTCASTGAARAL